MATETVPVEKPKTPEEIEREWFENVYAGDRMRQLTPRAVLMGMVLGMVMACSNVYVSLKAGWTFGVAITCSILAYVAFSSMHRFFPKQFPEYSILENNCMQSTAAAAGSMASGGLSNAIPALMMLNAAMIPVSFGLRCLWLIPWITVISMLGVFLAVPAKRQMINVEKLPFPTGTAAANTLRSLHTKGGEAQQQARTLGLAGLVGLSVAWLRDASAPWLDWYPKIPATWGTQWIRVGTFKDAPLMLNQVTMSFEGSVLFIGAGALISFRQAWSMLLGATINYVILAPIMLNAGVIETPSFRKISAWSLWIGVPMLVTSGLLMFFMNWGTVVRAFSSVTGFLTRRVASDDPMERIEVPGTWFLTGYAILGLAAIILGNRLFHIHWWMGLIAVLVTFFLVIVAARATGETDVTPIGPLSKITQLTFGAIAPGNVSTNLMTANISAGATGGAGELMQDLKSGYLLGASPRQQFLAQALGILPGALIAVPCYFILVPSVDMLGTEKWPAPAALVWRGVAELLAKGPGALHPTARIGLVIGATLGIVLTLFERWFPKQKKFFPSPTGLGLAFTFNGFNSVSFFMGSTLALLVSKVWPKVHERYTVPVASGLIAGESLMGVAVAFLTIARVLR